jgi:hypothetical protein
MVYLVKLECAFATKEEAVAFANTVESIKANCLVDTKADTMFTMGRKLQVWESTHDEVSPKPCSLMLDVNFATAPVVHKIDGITPKLPISEVTK